jgi:hypothetical protein
MYRTLSELRDSINNLIEQQGESEDEVRRIRNKQGV